MDKFTEKDDIIFDYDNKIIIGNAVRYIKEKAKKNVQEKTRNMQISIIQENAKNKIDRIIISYSEEDKKRILSKFTKITHLLEIGEFNFLLITEIANEDTIVTAILQPFFNTIEILINAVSIKFLSENELKMIFSSEISRSGNYKKYTISYYISRLPNHAELKAVLRQFNRFRNIGSHSYKEISYDSAKSMIEQVYNYLSRLSFIYRSNQ